MEIKREQLIELRRHKNTLAVIGLGVILFGFWSLVKIMVIDYINPLSEFMESIEEADRETFVAMYYTFLVIIVGFDVLLRLYVGINAIKAGNGTSKNKLGIIGFLLLILYDVIEIIMDFIGIADNLGNFRELTDFVAECVVDITSLFILILLLRAAIHYRRLQESGGLARAAGSMSGRL